MTIPPSSLVRLALVSVVTALATPAAAAQTITTDVPRCSGVQMVVLNDPTDSSLTGDAGLLGEVVQPVLAAANRPGDNADALFSAPSTAFTAQAGEGRWKPDVWGTTTATPNTPTTSAKEDTPAPAVGRTVITVESSNDTRPYLPGVTGPGMTPTYDESITTAITAVENVLADVNRQCPGTKVVLMGVGSGAQAASAVSKKIGDGQVFPADKVLGVSLFSDPSRADGQPVVASGAASPAGADGQWASSATPGAGIATVTGRTPGLAAGGYGGLADRTVSWCADGDTSCALPAGTPLRKLVAQTDAGMRGKAPQEQLAYIADVLAPSVLLGAVETLSSDVSFGDDGFSFSRAHSAENTLLGRIAATSGQKLTRPDMEQRLLASGMKLGGMALAAGITVAKEVITPAHIAQIAAAGAISPAAGVGTALFIAGGAASKLVNTTTLTTAVSRLADEAKAAGIDDGGVAQAALQAAVGREVTTSRGAYSTTGFTSDGHSAASATTDWLLNIVGSQLGRTLTTVSPITSPRAFDTAASDHAVEALA